MQVVYETRKSISGFVPARLPLKAYAATVQSGQTPGTPTGTRRTVYFSDTISLGGIRSGTKALKTQCLSAGVFRRPEK